MAVGISIDNDGGRGLGVVEDSDGSARGFWVELLNIADLKHATYPEIVLDDDDVTLSFEVCDITSFHAASETSTHTPGLVVSSFVSKTNVLWSDGIDGRYSRMLFVRS